MKKSQHPQLTRKPIVHEGCWGPKLGLNDGFIRVWRAAFQWRLEWCWCPRAEHTTDITLVVEVVPIICKWLRKVHSDVWGEGARGRGEVVGKEGEVGGVSRSVGERLTGTQRLYTARQARRA